MKPPIYFFISQLALVFFLVFVSGILSAQPEKGDIMIAGDISADLATNKTEKLRTYAHGGVTFNPIMGKCAGKGYVFGAGFSYGNFFDTEYDGNGNKFTRLSEHIVGLYLFSRDYTRIADKFYARSGTNVGYSMNMSRTKDFTTNIKSDLGLSNSFDIRFRMGLVYFPKPNIGIEFSYGEIGYNLQWSHILSGHPRSVSNHFNVQYGIDAIRIGLVVLLKGKKKPEEKKEEEKRK